MEDTDSDLLGGTTTPPLAEVAPRGWVRVPKLRGLEVANMADAGLLGLGVFGVRGVVGVSGIVGMLERELPDEVLLGENTLPFSSLLTRRKGSELLGRLIRLGSLPGVEIFRCGDGERLRLRLETLLPWGTRV